MPRLGSNADARRSVKAANAHHICMKFGARGVNRIPDVIPDYTFAEKGGELLNLRGTLHVTDEQSFCFSTSYQMYHFTVLLSNGEGSLAGFTAPMCKDRGHV